MADVKVLIAFYSRGGSTEALAKAIAEGAGGRGGGCPAPRPRSGFSREVMAHADGWIEKRRPDERGVRSADAGGCRSADAIILRLTPTRFGTISSELKAYIDSLGGLWFQGKLNGKAGSAFTSTQSVHGGNESTSIALYNPMVHLGMVIVPLGYADPALFKAGTPYGASYRHRPGQRPADRR